MRSRWGFAGVMALVGALAVGAGAFVASNRAPSPPAVGAVEASPTPTHAHGDDVHGDDPAAHGGSEELAVTPPVPEDAPIGRQRSVRLEHTMDGDTKVFALNAEPVHWELVPGELVSAWGYNGQVPGPEIWVEQGDQVRIEFTNDLPMPTTIHWHGVDVPIEMDGVPGVSQDPIPPGGTFTYEFAAEPSGTFWYHSHFDTTRQADMGLAGAFIIEDADDAEFDRDYVQVIDEWIRLPDGRNGWEGVAHAGHNPGEYNWFTLNGKSFPATENMPVAPGERARIRLINAGFQAHPMHLHGQRFLVIAKDGAMLPEPYYADTVLIGAGERYDLEYVGNRTGDWMFHCHIPHHTGNDTVEPGGLMSFVTNDGQE